MNNKTIRYGVVSSVDSTQHAVRVAFEDEDSMVSDWLPVIVSCASKNQDYALPDVGDRVVCAFLSNGVSAGFVIGAVYSQANRPPHSNGDVRSVKFSDGTTISYDRAMHVLSINCVGNIVINGTRVDIN